MIQKRALVLSCLAWCSFPSIVLADEVTSPAPQNSRGASLAKGQSDHIASLEDVVVTARRVPGLSVNAEEMPAHATVITEEQIARSGARSTVQVLQQLAGVSVLDVRGMGLGSDGGVNLRGVANSSRTGALVLVDGIRQNRITGDEVHWLSIPVSQIERIEVIRGGGATIYGEGALSGVINIITKRGADKPLSAETLLEGGSYGWWRSASTVRGTEGPISYGLGVTRQLWDGYRDSTASRATTVHLATTWTPTPASTLDVTVSQHDDTSHFAGGLTPATVERDRRNPGTFSGFFTEDIWSAGATWTQRIGEAWTVVGQLFARRWESDSTTTSTFANIAPSHGGGVRMAHERHGSQWSATTVAGLELSDDKATTGTRTATLSESNRHSGAAFIEETLKCLDRWIVTGGFRYDRSHYQEDLTFPTFQGKLRFNGRSPKVGVTYVASDYASLYASWARSFKAPNIDDLDAVLPPYNDNVSVQPQTADTTEAGIRVEAAPWARLNATVFHTRIDDEILFNAATFANANFTTRRTGAEIGIRGTAARDRLSYAAGYTFVRARFDKGSFTGNVIPGAPEHQLTGNVAVRPVPWLETALEAVWIDQPFRINNFANTLPGDVYGVVNATLRYVRPRHEVFLAIQNLLDEEYTSQQSSAGTLLSTGENPAPPRTFVLGVRMRT